MRKGGENLNGSGKEKGGNEETGDQEEVGMLLGVGNRIDPEGLSIERRRSVALRVERGRPLLGGVTPPSRYYYYYNRIVDCKLR